MTGAECVILSAKGGVKGRVRYFRARSRSRSPIRLLLCCLFYRSPSDRSDMSDLSDLSEDFLGCNKK